MRINKAVVLGGGSAGFMAAMALKAKLPHLKVLVIRSKDIGIIGVGEGSTYPLTRFLHQYIGVGPRKFFEIAQPTWKLGLKFLWGKRPSFHYTFGPGLESRVPTLPRNLGFYCEEGMDYYDPISAMMTHDRVFPRGSSGGPAMHNFIAYHFENEKFVRFLEGYAAAIGVEILEDTVTEALQSEQGIAALKLASGRTEPADLFVDSSGFISYLLGKTLGEPFISFKSSLFCDRAVVGGWARTDEAIKPYTTCETMNAGWCWQIEHETRINRGYVYCSDFISDDEAEREFCCKNPKVEMTRVVRFVSGRYRNTWVKNVVAIGNASGFVEPLEATALGVIAVQAGLVADSLVESGAELRPEQVRMFNRSSEGMWNSIRSFIAIHYKYNTRLDTPFWDAARNRTDLFEAQDAIDYYLENGPSPLWEKAILKPFEQFGMAGYLAMLVGQQVPYAKPYTPSDRERAAWRTHCEKNRGLALKALSVKESLAAIRSPQWDWAATGKG